MKYGKEVVEPVIKQFKKIDGQIADIEAKLTDINKKLKESEQDFDIEAIESRKELVAERDLYAESLKKAKAHRKAMLDNGTDKVVADIDEVVQTAITKAQDKNKARVAEQKEKIDEFLQLADEIEAENAQLQEDLKITVNAIKPYVNKESQNRKNTGSYGSLASSVSYNRDFLETYLDKVSINQIRLAIEEMTE